MKLYAENYFSGLKLIDAVLQVYFKEPWKFEASKVVKHKDGDYYFHLTVSQELPDKKIEDTSTLMGVDAGINYLAVASTTDK